MKVGTDGVLLGAWCPIDNNPFSILDIGAGTGILSLILALIEMKILFWFYEKHLDCAQCDKTKKIVMDSR